MKNNESIKNDFEKYLDDFDEHYCKHFEEKQKVIPILLKTFEQYEEDIYALSSLDKEIHALQLKIRNELEKKCNTEQIELIEQLRYCISAENSELIEKAFIYGFCVSQSLKEKTKKYINNKY